MNRALLLISLSLFAPMASAAKPAITDEATSTCSKPEDIRSEARDSNAPTPAVTPAVRTTTPSRNTPRWNSLLPGNFR